MINNEHKNCPYCNKVIKAKAIKCKHCKSMIDNNAISKGDSIVIRPDKVPEDVLNLLWFSDGPYANFTSQAEHIITTTAEGFVFEISMMGTKEPSLISMELPIIMPNNNAEIEPLSYFPSYSSISPQQRWIYLNWLRNIESSIDIGYVFIFYYGLERHLFFGNYETAFDMILRLRKHHKNNSFNVYSSNALIAATLFHKREDLFFNFINCIESFDHIDLSHVYVLAKRLLGIALSPAELMALAKKVGFTNKRYLKNEKELFELELRKLLLDKHGEEKLSLEKYSLNKCPLANQMIIANYSLEHEQRTISVPSLIEAKVFSTELLMLLQSTHENVKKRLKESRKSKQ